ncbi:hypothetical protein AAVH_12108 [Aphelenchoides avenae]|nr:hypothetical protein AAVH_12108 [Aphelenchus avenae]
MQRIHLYTLFLLVGLASATFRANAITKVRNLISTFLTDIQVGKVLDSIAIDLYNMRSTDTIVSNLRNRIMGTLSQSQMYQATYIYARLANGLGGPYKADICFNKIIEVLRNNIDPLAEQYLTYDRMKLLLTRIKGKLLVEEWRPVRQETSGVVLWAKYYL